MLRPLTVLPVGAARFVLGIAPARRQLRLKVALFLVLLAMVGMVVWAPAASAHFCVHFDHTHPHEGHTDSHDFLQHYNFSGDHFHDWRNLTHGYNFTVNCGPGPESPQALAGLPAIS